MKKMNTLYLLGLMGAMLTLTSVKAQAAITSVMSAEETSSDVLPVTLVEGSASYYQGTLADGSVLGFEIYGYNEVALASVATSVSSLTIPGKLSMGDSEYVVTYFGNYYGGEILPACVASLTLPASITYIVAKLPATVINLHLQGENPPSLYYSIPSSTTVWVPQSAVSTYQSAWSDVIVRYEGWEPKTLTVNVATPGTFASELMKQLTQWNEVDELVVMGTMNEEEMELLSRLSQMEKLDLSLTDITRITGCHDLRMLKTVVLPPTVQEIGNSAFSNCRRLTSINTGSVVTVGESAFKECYNLKEIDLQKAITIQQEAFYYCSGLTSISLSVTKTISDRAFYSCDNLVSVSIPEAEILGNESFGSTNIEMIVLPKVKELGENCFSYCHSLRSVSFSEGLEAIPSYCFYNCNVLNTVNFPSTLKSIGGEAFGYTALTSAVLPEGLLTIDYYAFYGCPLTTISIPSSIQSIRNAFYGCSNVKDVYCYAIVPPATEAFRNMTSATLHVPTFSVTSYMLDENWYRFYQTVAIEGKVGSLNVNQSFTINTYDGLEDKVALSLGLGGHLTVSAGSPLNLSSFTQVQSVTNESYYDGKGGLSTLIANNEINADQVTLRLQVYTNRWNFISLPFDVNVADIEYPEGTLWVIRKYSGADRAALTGNTWQNMTDGMTLQAGEGYILHCNNDNGSLVEFVFHPCDNDKKNGLFAYQDIVKPLAKYDSEFAHNRSWNLVGNPYPSCYQTTSIEHNGVITVYNSGYYYSDYGSYTAYSLLDDNYVLRPNEAFFVQCPSDASSMTFKAEGRTHAFDGINTSTRMPAHRAQQGSDRQVYNITLTGNDFTDRARVVINPEAKMDYEISCDASKFMSERQDVPQLYVCDNGIRYAIDERPLGDGVIALGTRFGQTAEYILALKDCAVASPYVLLTDNKTGRQVNLAEESYAFTAEAGADESRFTLTFKTESAGIDEVQHGNTSAGTALYDLQGRKSVSHSKKGIYIVKQNGKSRKVIR